MGVRFYNSLTRKKEFFSPIKKGKVGLYTCGPTVYWYAHIGNLRTYIFEDILKRVLEYNGYKVKHVMNITDVGHLTSNEDYGEDKIEKKAKEEKKTVWEIAEFYTKAFKEDLELLNIIKPDIWVRATQTINDQINLIKILEKKGFTYKIKDGIYFDTSKLKTYGRLWPKKIKAKAKPRIEITSGKKNPADFALWKFSPKEQKRQMEWDSPWGKGFPGWHTECVVMAIKYLRIPFDIHCGGIDHILIHHTNEIAQAEAAFGKIPANFWLHGEFLLLESGRMGKSEGNIITLRDLIKRKFNPLAYRYLCLNTHYRSKLSFSWDSLKSAQSALNNLYLKVSEIKPEKSPNKIKSKEFQGFKENFLKEINDDLNIPKALALCWKIIKSPLLSNGEKYNLLLDFDRVFGLNLKDIKKVKVPLRIQKLVKLREKYRQEKKWKKADEVREEVQKNGYLIEDTKEGPKIKLNLQNW